MHWIPIGRSENILKFVLQSFPLWPRKSSYLKDVSWYVYRQTV